MGTNKRINWGRGRGFDFQSCLFRNFSRLLTHNSRARYALGRYVPIIQKLIHRLKTFPISMGSVILLLPVITIWPFWFTDYDPAVFAHFFNFIFAPLFILFIGSIHEIEKSPRFISLIVLIAFFGTALSYLGWVFSSGELAKPDFMTFEIVKFELLIQALAGAGAFIIQGMQICNTNWYITSASTGDATAVLVFRVACFKYLAVY